MTAIISLLILALIAVALVVVGLRNARLRRRKDGQNQRIDLFHKDDPPA